MRWSSRRDGATAVYDEAPAYEPGGDDMIVVEPIITSFVPTRDGRCGCGAPLDFRCAAAGAEVFCFRCHAVIARVELGTRVHR
jgi:hypothetical protein